MTQLASVSFKKLYTQVCPPKLNKASEKPPRLCWEWQSNKASWKRVNWNDNDYTRRYKRIQQCRLAIKNTDRNFPPMSEQQLSEHWIPHEFSHELFSPHRRNATFHCSSRFLSSLDPHPKTVSRSISLFFFHTISLMIRSSRWILPDARLAT